MSTARWMPICASENPSACNSAAACADNGANMASTSRGERSPIDMRYAGQGYEITIACRDDLVRDGSLEVLREKFDQQHKLMFGHSAPEEPVEIVSYRVRGVGKVPPVEMPRFKSTGASLADAQRA